MKRIVVLILCCILLIPLAGCWSKRELEQLAVVTVIGMDKITVDGQDKFQITARIMNPQGNKGSDSTQSKNDESLLTGIGNTIQETAREATLRTPRQPYFGQMETIIVGERLAKDGLEQIIQLLGRYPETRLRTVLLVAKGTAYDILNTEPEIDTTLSREITDMAHSQNVRIGVTCGRDLNQVFQDLLADDRTVITGSIEKEKSLASGEGRIRISGIGVFRKDKLADFLDIDETIGCLLLQGKLKNSRTPIAIIRSDKEFFTYLLLSGKSKIIPEVQGDSIHYQIKIETTGNVDDVSGIEITPESIPELENEIGEKVIELVQKTIDKAKNLNSDFCGLGYSLHRKEPETWHELSGKWDEVFPNITYDLSVTVHIKNNGKLNKNIEVIY